MDRRSRNPNSMVEYLRDKFQNAIDTAEWYSNEAKKQEAFRIAVKKRVQENTLTENTQSRETWRNELQLLTDNACNFVNNDRKCSSGESSVFIDNEKMCEMRLIYNEKIIQNKGICCIIQELVLSEETYINSLKNGIENYVPLMDLDTLPESLKGQKYIIFSTIKEIFEFHKNEFLPKLRECKEDVEEICDLFCEMIRVDHFYPYIKYAMNLPRSDALVDNNKHFFEKHAKQFGDRLGIKSFLVLPIQRICKYGLFLSSIIKHTLKEYATNYDLKPTLNLYCKTDIELTKLVDLINEAMTFNDINYDDDQSDNIKYCYQEVFRKGADFEILDSKYKPEKFKGRLFIFEHILIYTEYSDNAKQLNYRGSFKREALGIRVDSNNKNCFYISDTMKINDEVSFYGPLTEEVFQIINGILLKIVEEEKQKGFKRVSTRLLNILNRIKTEPERTTITFQINNPDHYEITRPSWSPPKTFEKIRISEKYYIHLMKINVKFWLYNLETNAQTNFEEFQKLFELIYDFHSYVFYPAVIKCTSDYVDVINLFKTHFVNEIFNIYIMYSAIVPKTIIELKKCHDIPPSLDLSVDVHDFVCLPIQRITDYRSLIDVYVQKEPLINEAAILQVEFHRFQKTFFENYKLYSIEQTKINMQQFGNVLYSDKVSIDLSDNLIFNHRIFLMEGGILCVKVDEEPNTRHETYHGIVSNILYTTKLNIRGIKYQPKRIDFDTDIIQSITPSIIFRTPEKRQIFCERLLDLI